MITTRKTSQNIQPADGSMAVMVFHRQCHILIYYYSDFYDFLNSIVKYKTHLNESENILKKEKKEKKGQEAN